MKTIHALVLRGQTQEAGGVIPQQLLSCPAQLLSPGQAGTTALQDLEPNQGPPCPALPSPSLLAAHPAKGYC